MTAETHWQRKVMPPNATDWVEISAVDGDVDDRFKRNVAGKMEWGNGADDADTNLYRSTANTLKTDGNMEIGGTATLTGLMTLAAGLKLPVTTATCATTGTQISNNGLTVLTSTTTKTFGLAAPVAGVLKAFICTASGTSVKTVKAASGTTVDGTNDDLTFNAANEACILIGASSTRWAVISNVNSVGIS